MNYIESGLAAVASAFNVKTYGAVGDGVTLDHAAIIAADAAAATAGGGTVFFPRGTYKCAANLTPSSGNAWRGEGVGSQINLVDDATATSRTIYILSKSDVTVENLYIQQSNAASRTGVYGLIRIESSSRVTVRNCKIGKSSSTGIHVIQGTDLLFEGNVVSGTLADGIHVSRNSVRVRILGNTVTASNDDGIAIISYTDVTGVYPNCEDIVVAGNTVSSILTGRGIAVYGGRNILVTSNTISTTDHAGIIISGSPATGALSTTTTRYAVMVGVVGNTIRNVGVLAGATTKSGIYVSNVRQLRIADNNIDTAAADGVTLAGVVKDVTVVGNTINRAAARGILLTQTTSTDARLIQELFTDLGETGVVTARSADVTVTSNTVRKSTSEGISFIGAAAADLVKGVVVAENTVNSNGFDGIALLYCDTFAVEGNTVRGNAVSSYAGIRVSLSGHGAVVGNGIAANDTGLLLVSANTTLIAANQLNVNASGGLYEDAGSANNHITGNWSSGNTGFDYNTSGTGSKRFGNFGDDINIYRSAAGITKTDNSFHVGLDFRHLGTNLGFYGVTQVARAAAITSPAAPSAGYVQAEAAAMKTAVDAIRVALTNLGLTS